MVSALTGDGLDALLDALAAAMPEGPYLYPEDDLTDLPDRLLAAEIVREQIFMQTHEEVPYARDGRDRELAGAARTARCASRRRSMSRDPATRRS